MNPTILIRCIVATLAATTLLTAQSAPAERAKARAETKAETKSGERMQVRLAEVIAMLEEDDLSPEQRAMAKKKLEEIVARLREAPTPPPTPSAPSAPARVRELLETRGFGVAEAPAAPAPSSRPRTFTFKSAEGGEGTMVIGGQDPVAPAAPSAPAKAPKPPKAPKAPKAPKPDSVTMPLQVEIAETAEGEAPARVIELEGGLHVVEVPKGAETVDVIGTVKERAKLGELAEIQDPAKRASVEARVVERLEAAKQANRLSRTQFEKARAEAAEAAEKAQVMQRDQALVRTRAARDAAEMYRAAEEQKVRADQSKAKAEGQAKAKLFRSLAQSSETREEEVEGKLPARSRVLRVVGSDGAQAEAKVLDVAPLRPGTYSLRRAAVADGGDDDAEIKQLIEEMRAEMREIRKLIEQLKKAQTSAAPRARAGFDAFGGMQAPASPFGGAAGMPGEARGRAPRSAAGGVSTFGGGGAGGGVGGQAGGQAQGQEGATGQGSTNLRWSTKAPAQAGFGISGGDRLIEVNGEPVQSKAQGVETARRKYAEGVRTFDTRWQSGGQTVNRRYEASIR